MKAKEKLLENLQAKIIEWQHAYSVLKDLPDEMFEAGFAAHPAAQSLKFTAPPLSNTIGKREYGDKKKFVREIIAAEKNGLKRSEIISRYETLKPGEVNINGTVTNAITALYKDGEIEPYKPKGMKGKGSNWRIKAKE